MKIFKTIIPLFFAMNLFSQCPPDLQTSMLTQTLTCNNPTILATASSTTPNTVIYWLVPSTPSMIVSPSIIVGPPNGPPTTSVQFNYANYTVVATNTVMMCNSSSVVVVNQNFKPPYFEVKGTLGQSVICNNSGLTLYMSKTYTGSPMPWELLTNLCWSGPSPQTPTCSFYYNANIAGIYSLTGIDNYNGCSATNTMMVFDSRPQFGLQGTAPTSSATCNGSLIVTTQIPNGYSLSATSGSLNGTILSNLCYGWVKVCMTASNTGCFKCDSILMNAATSLNEINFEDEISIYPNPTSSSFFIKNDSNKNVNVKVFNLEGREIENVAFGDVVSRASTTRTSTEIEIRNLKPGIYFIEIHSENSVLRKKLIINP